MQIVVNPQGDIKVVGKITPSKEYVLFPQREQPFRKDLAKFKAHAGYGFPVIGTVGVFAEIDVFLWALPGPGLLKDIQIEGEYSTDPKERQSYSLSATLNISAAAGITLRAAGGLQLTILAHDIKVGVGVNGTLGIKGYANAPVIIGYREEGGENEDKKGSYYIKGELEVAAQPFLSLAGDLFIELDSPWISPLPDKTWTWPLGDMEWPLGGSFGLKASVEHVIGSHQIPEIEFQEIDFSGDKFMTDIIDQKTAPSAKRAAETAGQWKEKNEKSSTPPPVQTTAKGAGGKGTNPQKGISAARSTMAPIKPTAPTEKASKKQKKNDKMGKEIQKVWCLSEG
ncbi:MAG: hypothetical protein P0116_14395 [Candidatus Nitrosocosmicus sp.]|nr:hypothetical protein [Candidatus Nitrosocosmicus sp.]